MPAVIAENDESKWADETGARYHFPKQYRPALSEGMEVLYYKGKMKNKAFSDQRLSTSPHYFGVARVGKIYADKDSTKGDLFADIEDFKPFDFAVPNKIDGEYLEPIPLRLKNNYWRRSAREIDQSVFDRICSLAVLRGQLDDSSGPIDGTQEFETRVTGTEGKKVAYYGVRYERNAKLRLQAIEIHGLRCNACEFDFEKAYGEHAKGFIHVHHVKPISEYEEDQVVDPATDMITLCANCHAVAHRNPQQLLSVEQLKSLLNGRWVFDDLT
ncbi:restriction endonuclease [Pseudomonas mandelii]|uniref:HNH endonuclease n=1 Tax=Pseudomonas mandelii TaxID=75612 RepID=UPI00398D180E